MLLKLCLLGIGLLLGIDAIAELTDDTYEDVICYIVLGISLLLIALALCLRPVENIQDLSATEVTVTTTKANGKVKEKTYYLLNGKNIQKAYPVKNYKVIKTVTEDVVKSDGTAETRTVSRVKYRAK